MIAGALGILMFIAGFLRWLKLVEGDGRQKYSGFAFGMPRGRGVPSAVPTARAATSLLLAIGVWLGNGAISPELGSKVGVEIGLIVGLVIAVIQTAVLGMELASRRDNDEYDTVTRTRG